MTPPAEVFSDENDIEKNNESESATFSIDDDDECVIEDADEDSDDDSVEHRVSMSKMFRDSDDNGIIHDQLPSVEEVKASNAYLPTARLIAQANRRKLYLIVAAAALVAMVLSVSITVGVFKRTNTNNISAPADVADALVDKPAAEGSQSKKLDTVIMRIYHAGVSTLPDLQMFRSPEHNAAAFVAVGDAYNASITYADDHDRRRFLERYVLALVFYQTNGQKWIDNLNFLTPTDHCDWNKIFSTPRGAVIKGVQCDNNGFVMDLDLSNNNLVADQLPREIGFFNYAKKLHLFGNTIGGQIPVEYKEMSNLNSLGLMHLKLRGKLPSFLGEMTTLTTLALSNTLLYDKIPESFSNLKKLRVLGLDGLGLTGSILPVARLSMLEALYLEDNHLTGDLGDDVVFWPKMQELDISNNQITGHLHENLFEISSLAVLDLNNNYISGEFPQRIEGKNSLQYLSLYHNNIGGSFSDRVGYLDELKHLDVSHNRLKGSVPDTIQLLTNLVSLSTSGNFFSEQTLDVEFFLPLTNLQDLSMKGNNITGTISHEFSRMRNLRMFDLDGNKLRGTIPSTLGTMSNLAILQLNRNKLMGTIPSELSNLKKLQVLLLDGNDLKGETKELCSLEAPKLAHFTADCYPSMMDELGPEVECRCCTLCCADENTACNNLDWSASYDPKGQYGYIRPAYNFNLEKAPSSWGKPQEMKLKAVESF